VQPANRAEPGTNTAPALNRRTLNIIVRVEPTTIAAKPLLEAAGTTTTVQKRLFNAGLVLRDGVENVLPYLADALPTLGTSTWTVAGDGRMETTYRLRPNLTWHDGTPLSAEDFVFGWNVYARPEFGQNRLPPLNRIGDVVAGAGGAVVIHWLQPYPFAGMLVAADLQPLPRHLLEESLDAGADFPNHPFWSREYIGLGPYTLERWEPGAAIEAAAFPAHALGRPKIDRVRLAFVADQNTVLANLLSHAADISVDFSIRVEQTRTLRDEWGRRNSGGTVLFSPSTWRFTQIQRRPEYLTTPGVLDLRVRQALAYANDRDALNEGLFGGEGIMTDTMIPANVEYYPVVERAITKFPYEPRRAELLMAEAGFTKGPDGVYARAADGRFSPELMVQTSAQSERELSIMASTWRQFGFDVQERVLPAALVSDGEARSTFRTLASTGGNWGETALIGNFTTSRIPGPSNRWGGSNRGAWSVPEFDRLAEAFESTLDATRRVDQVVAMAKLVSDDVPVISLFFDLQPIAFSSVLQGPGPFVSDVSWNVHQWELR
jgi:peptide/nickel transport system substrate-binding protein